MTRSDVGMTLGLTLGLTAIAVVWREPSYMTDRDIYQQIGRQFIIPDCSSLHCTRILVAGVLEHLPAPSLVAWKAYAIVANLVAALGVAALCRWFGMSRRLSWIGAMLVAFGRGSQLTLFDPYTSDPFIYALTPWMTLQLAQGRVARAGAAAALGVFAKEFAAGPLWIFAIVGVLARRRDLWLRSGAAALAVTLMWLVYQVAFALHFNYSYGGNPSSRLQSGAYLATWIQSLGWWHAGASLALHLLPILLLAAAGYSRAPAMLRRVALASIPAALLLCYVQQPDRALWNFEWAIVPLAALMFADQPTWLVATFLATYAIVNLPAWPDTSIRALTLPFCLCLGAVGLLIRGSGAGGTFCHELPQASTDGDGQKVPPAPDPRVLGVLAVLLVAVGLVAGDIAVHRSIESGYGVNVWGYRGPVAKRKSPREIRVVVLGGRQVFGQQVENSIPGRLDEYLNVPWMRQNSDYRGNEPMSVVNLATPYDRPATFTTTLRHYDHLQYDVACLYVGRHDPAPDDAAARGGWRRQSAVYRATGYLPVFPSVWNLKRQDDLPAGRAAEAGDAPDDRPALEEAFEYSLARGTRILLATDPLVRGAEALRQDDVARWVEDRYGRDRRVRYQDLRRVVDVSAPNLDGYIAESLSQNVFRLLNQ